jgi:dipeptidyl aminopeptidase/acylaminoacyl peptidase
MVRRPYGTWESSITPELMARGGLRIGFPEIEADGSFTWVEGRPAEGGRSVVVRRGPGGETVDLVPAPLGARSRVHEYGGRGHAFDGGALLFVDPRDHRLHRAVAGVAEPVTEPSGWRFGDLVVLPSRRFALAVGELHTPGRRFPDNGLVAVDLSTGDVQWAARGHDFYAAPAVSPNGRTVAYLAWDMPHMPWDAATLFVAPIDERGAIGEPRAAGGGVTGSAFQPTFGPDGALYASVEVDDRWQLHRLEGGELVRLPAIDLEIGAPLWLLGTRLFAFSDARTLVAAGFAGGVSRIVALDLATGRWRTVNDRLGHVGELTCRGREALVGTGWAGQAQRLLRVDLETGESTIVRDALEGLVDPDDVSAAEPVSYPTDDGDVVHAFFYAPRSRRFAGPEGARPPLVVLAHGGPTGCATATLQLSTQFWSTRGFAVLDVNYRGSTGFGRAYREKLRGRWGTLDVADCVTGVRAMAAAGRIDPSRAIIRGASAGGYTVLQALADHDVFRAAACLYGPSDPKTFASETHKFEAEYDRFLFGTGEARDRALDERAPIRKVDRIRAPVIFFQGLEDPAVVPEQTRRIHDALAARGVETEYYGYEGELHGFRRAETIRDVWDKELAFYRRVLGLASSSE